MSLWKLQNAPTFTAKFHHAAEFCTHAKENSVVFTWEFTVSLGNAKSSSGYFTGSFTDQTGELQKLFPSRNTHGGNRSCRNF